MTSFGVISGMNAIAPLPVMLLNGTVFSGRYSRSDVTTAFLVAIGTAVCCVLLVTSDTGPSD